MENKKEYKQIKRIKELISEETLYGKLIDKEILSEANVKNAVDELISYFFNSMKKSKVSVSEDILSSMKTTANDIFDKKISTKNSGSLIKKYIDEDLLNDISDILMAPTKNTDVFPDGSKEIEIYSGLVNEYIDALKPLIVNLKEGNFSIESLKSKKEVNRLLSLVGGESGEGFYKKYDMIALADTNKIISNLPPYLQKTYTKILQKTSILTKIASIPVDMGYYNSLNHHWDNITKAKGYGRKSWQVLILPFKLMTKKGWIAYTAAIFIKAFLIYQFCKGKSGSAKLEESLLKEGMEGGWFELVRRLAHIVWYFGSVPVINYFKTVGVDPLGVVPSLGLFEWDCGSPATYLFGDMIDGLKEAKEKNKCVKFNDGEEICGVEIEARLEQTLYDTFGGKTELVDFIDTMESFKQQIEEEIRKNGK